MISSLAGNLSAKLSHQTEWEADIDFTTTYERIHKGWFVRNTTCCPRDLRKASAKLSHKLTMLTGIDYIDDVSGPVAILSTLMMQFLFRYREIVGDFTVVESFSDSFAPR